MKNKSLLVISHTYNTFIKDQVESLAPYFTHIHVLVRYKPIAEISNLIPIDYLLEHRKSCVLDLENKPDNVSVYTTPLFYLPFDFFYQRIGNQHLKACIKIIESNNIEFDLIHSHFAWSAGYVGSKLKKIYNKPFVLTTHGEDVYDLPFRNNLWKNLISNIIEDADLNTTVSEYNKRVIGVLVPKVKTMIIPNSYRKKLFYLRDRECCRSLLGISTTNKIIVSIGSLLKIKGHSFLINALKQLNELRSDFVCYIIGDGPQRNNLKNQINQLQLRDKIKLVPAQRHSQIGIWLGASELMVLPSISESFGIVQIEAGACGVPTVATINGGSENIIKDGLNGFLARNSDPNDITAKIQIALDTKWDRKKIIDNASANEAAHIATIMVKEYKKLLLENKVK